MTESPTISVPSDNKCEKCGSDESSIWHTREAGRLLCNTCLLDTRNSSILTFCLDNNLDSAGSSSARTVSSSDSRPSRKTRNTSLLRSSLLSGLRSKESSRRTFFKSKPVKSYVRSAKPITSDQVWHNGRFFRIGDIVAMRDIEDSQQYFAQIDGLMTDVYAAKSACVTWLLPSPAAPKDGSFTFGSYFAGPSEDLARPLDCMEFVCHGRSHQIKPVLINSVGLV